MKIAIVGTGFAGLSIAWHLHAAGVKNITLFDKVGIGGGASGIAAGLLHPYGGARCRLNANGREGLAATLSLLEVASKHLGVPVAKKSGLFRIPVSEEQREQFSRSAQLYHLPWKTYLGQEALFIEDAWCVDCPLYLEGLWQACHALGSCLEIEHLTSVDTLRAFDKVVIAAGAESKTFHQDLPFKQLKGQIVVVPNHFSELQVPITAESYVIPQQNELIIGATFERSFSSVLPDPSFAMQALIPHLESILPGISKAPVLQCKAGIRAATPNYMPFIKRISEQVWVAAGLGSKGLLYHGLFGKSVTSVLLN